VFAIKIKINKKNGHKFFWKVWTNVFTQIQIWSWIWYPVPWTANFLTLGKLEPKGCGFKAHYLRVRFK
jgi:hypothetical protein